ncbi:MAG: hypothetical protein GY854_11085 [Deltaproteobacteria bacterium]|nr:hypothetical protein [Deltaproteobacteria bacterium]
MKQESTGHPWGSASLFALILLSVSGIGFAAEADEDGVEQDLSDEQREEAKGYFVDGGKAYEKGDYQRAIDKFRKAYDITHSPEILYNIGRCHEKLEEHEEAIYNYEMYLRLYSTADDAEDVRHRINMLRDLKKTDSDRDEGEREDGEEETEVEETADESWWSGIRIGADLGLFVGLSGPASGMVMPIEVMAYYPFGDWFSLGLSLNYGRFLNAKSKDAYPAESQAGIQVYGRGDWSLSDSLAIVARLGAGPTSLGFAHLKSRITWLAMDVGGGIAYQFGENWCLLAELFAALGPVFRDEKEEIEHTNLDAAGMQIEIGLKVGVEYVF